MRIAVGQFAVGPDWRENAEAIVDLTRRAEAGGAEILVLPEGVLARDITDPEIVRKSAQPLDGPFLSELLAESRGHGLVSFFCVHVPADNGRVFNTQIALGDGEIIATYRKLHLYDAFSTRESEMVEAGRELPPILTISDMKVGMMTCYDARFPELARDLALRGAELVVMPSAWVRGPGKERHWEVLVTARALDNTCYLAASGECGPRNIGSSMVVDPLGVAIARAGEGPGLIFAEITRERLAEARQKLPVLPNRRFAPPELN